MTWGWGICFSPVHARKYPVFMQGLVVLTVRTRGAFHEIHSPCWDESRRGIVHKPFSTFFIVACG